MCQNTDKNIKIGQTRRATRDRRSFMKINVCELKVDMSKVGVKKRKLVNQLFREAKYVYNAVLASDDIFKYPQTFSTVLVLRGDKLEDYKLEVIGSQIKQSMVASVQIAIRSLAQLKKNGHKIGRLKFKSYCNSVPLKQYGTTYKIDFDNSRV